MFSHKLLHYMTIKPHLRKQRTQQCHTWELLLHTQPPQNQAWENRGSMLSLLRIQRAQTVISGAMDSRDLIRLWKEKLRYKQVAWSSLHLISIQMQLLHSCSLLGKFCSTKTFITQKSQILFLKWRHNRKAVSRKQIAKKIYPSCQQMQEPHTVSSETSQYMEEQTKTGCGL